MYDKESRLLLLQFLIFILFFNVYNIGITSRGGEDFLLLRSEDDVRSFLIYRTQPKLFCSKYFVRNSKSISLRNAQNYRDPHTGCVRNQPIC